MSFSFVKFLPRSAESISGLNAVIEAIAADLASGSRRSDLEWRQLFDANAIAYFWSPTDAEIKEWEEEWFSTPVEGRSNPELWPLWQFASMIDSLLCNEWQILGLKQTSQFEAVVEFSPFSHPFCGTGCLHALIESFGHSIIGDDDGTDYRPYEKRRVWWVPKSLRGEP
jgi:hypothetical protein